MFEGLTLEVERVRLSACEEEPEKIVLDMYSDELDAEEAELEVIRLGSVGDLTVKLDESVTLLVTAIVSCSPGLRMFCTRVYAIGAADKPPFLPHLF